MLNKSDEFDISLQTPDVSMKLTSSDFMVNNPADNPDDFLLIDLILAALKKK